MSSAKAMRDAEQGKPRRRKCIDETGKVYGRLTVVEYAPGHEGSGAMWRVRCRCGRERLARGFLLRAGLIKSCGCLLPRGDRRRETTPLHTDPVLELMRERDELRARLIDAVQERNAARADWESCALNLAEVTRERDRSLACWEAAGMQGKSAHAAMLELAAMRDRLHEQVRTLNSNIETFQREAWRYKRERDAARATVVRLQAEELERGQPVEEESLETERLKHALADATNETTRARLQAKREIEALTDERDELLVRVANQDAELRATREAYIDAKRTNAYRRGAEAMREACANAMHPIMRSMISRTEAAQTIRALPIPEEP